MHVFGFSKEKSATGSVSDSKRSHYIAHLDASHPSAPIIVLWGLCSNSIWNFGETELVRVGGMASESALACYKASCPSFRKWKINEGLLFLLVLHSSVHLPAYFIN